MNDESEHQEWILCPKCGNKTRLKLRKDTVLTNFPLFCPKCKEESLIDAEKFIVKEARREDAVQIVILQFCTASFILWEVKDETLFWEYGNNSYYTYDCIVGWVCWILNQ